MCGASVLPRAARPRVIEVTGGVRARGAGTRLGVVLLVARTVWCVACRYLGCELRDRASRMVRAFLERCV